MSYDYYYRASTEGVGTLEDLILNLQRDAAMLEEFRDNPKIQCLGEESADGEYVFTTDNLEVAKKYGFLSVQRFCEIMDHIKGDQKE